MDRGLVADNRAAHTPPEAWAGGECGRRERCRRDPPLTGRAGRHSRCTLGRRVLRVGCGGDGRPGGGSPCRISLRDLRARVAEESRLLGEHVLLLGQFRFAALQVRLTGTQCRITRNVNGHLGRAFRL